jgi:LPS sulfotransferase NodH
MSAEVLVVSGFARCGSSLAMQMLRAGGVRCVGRPPSFEDMRSAPHGPIEDGWFAKLRGRAVKVLEPALNRIPARVPRRAIWLDRDPEDQARSYLRFLRFVHGIVLGNEGAMVGKLARSLARDRQRSIACLGVAPLIIRFERILAQPAAVADEIATFSALELDRAAMAAVVGRHALEYGVLIDPPLSPSPESHQF